MTTKSFKNSKLGGQSFYQDFILLSFISQIEKIEK